MIPQLVEITLADADVPVQGVCVTPLFNGQIHYSHGRPVTLHFVGPRPEKVAVGSIVQALFNRDGDRDGFVA